MATMKKAQTGKNVPKGMVESEMFPGKMIPKSKSNYYTGEYTKMLEGNRKATLKEAAKKEAKQAANEIGKSPAKKNNPLKEMISNFSEAEIKKAKAASKKKMQGGGMIKRADGSYSKRGLWDNIRANKGSGKKPTAAMLKQEKKIKAKTKK